MAEYRHYAQPHPHWSDFPKNLPPNTKICGMNRDHLPVSAEDDLTIEELEDAVKTKVECEPIILRSYRRSGLSDPLPLLVYIHGGGFVTGGLETDDSLCRAIARDIEVFVINVKYRLAPENSFPDGFEDCLQVIKWAVTANAQTSYNFDLTKGFLVGGTSAGGNFTAALAHAMLEENITPQPTGLLFMASSFCHPDVRPAKYCDRMLSVEEINDAPGLTAKSIRYFADKYGAPPDDPRYSPLLHKSRRGLAKKAFFQICGWDPRRDEAILYSELLQEEHVESKAKIYSGLPHGFWTTCPGLAESVAAQKDTVEGVRWLLDP